MGRGSRSIGGWRRDLLRLGSAALWLLVLLWISSSVSAQEPVPSATPDAEGNIYVEVQPNDSLWGIAAAAGLTLNELLALNGLAEDAIIQPGQRLLIGVGPPPATATVELPPTATLPPPTRRPTVAPPRTAICLTAYDDENQNGMWDSGESLRAAVAFTVFDDTAVVANYITDGVAEPYCVEGLHRGAYHVTRSIAPNEVLTNDGDWAISLAPGDVAQLAFGSYLAATATATAPVLTPPAGSAPALPVTTAPTGTPIPTGTNTATPRTTTVFLAIGLVVMILFVAVICLVIWRQLRRES